MHVIHTVFSRELGRIFNQEVAMKVCTKKQVRKCPDVHHSLVSGMAWLLLELIIFEVKRRTFRSQASLPTSVGFPLGGLP